VRELAAKARPSLSKAAAHRRLKAIVSLADLPLATPLAK
jgi:hypothetical protein